MNQQDIELQLWAYIDGLCNDDDKVYVENKIATDQQWKIQYQQLITLHTAITANDLEQPSMRFSKNVMDIIEQDAIFPAKRQYLNPFIIRGIFAFFILSLISFLTYSLFTADWKHSNSGVANTTSLSQFSFGKLFNNEFFNLLIWINVVIGLLLVDTLLRRKRVSNYKS